MKPSLILLHGALGSRAQLQPLKQILLNDFEINLLDFEGHGINALPEHEFRIEHFAENLLAFINHHQLTPANIFGYSMGGFVALHLAITNPKSINRIFTLATKLDWNPQSAAREAEMLNADSLENKFPDYVQSLQQRHSADWKQVVKRTADMMLHLGQNHPLNAHSLSQMEHRVRLSVGDRDRMVSLEETVEWFRKIKHAELQVFPHTQHPLERMDLEMLADALKDFFLYDR